MLAILSGSGLNTLPEFVIQRREVVRTPYGLPSAPIYFGHLGEWAVALLARHGANHVWAPHEINYRANIWALHHMGAQQIISVSAVASLVHELQPGSLVVPHDLIDYTHNRAHTFFEGQSQEVVHTDFSEPYDSALRQRIIQLARDTHTAIHAQAVYACTQGPRLATMAEAKRFAQDGGDLLGMTGMPEAILAKELGMAYAHVCGIIGYAANIQPIDDRPDFRRQHTHQAMAYISRLLSALTPDS
ncbi:S-methyl-5'-thioinosine phosphorylase [Snodgrassella sp. CFCC 13594]|uniref:S-methyl-5'-thioinosine phosphorylase n=1 Tax=Snodgrassella sp. CFCC 13594 TaxID=1775559 RepID=UPI0008357C7A|nr:S-methyl-5'-thioinosine phosphorylase [Snodgrassella sp. CFCC 13594]